MSQELIIEYRIRDYIQNIADSYPLINNFTVNNVTEYTLYTLESQKAFEVTEEPFTLAHEEKECPICFETREEEEFCELNCGHKFCHKCIKKCMKSMDTCSLCRTRVETIKTQNDENTKKLEKLSISKWLSKRGGL
jgi:hypothetical protein